MPEEKQPSLRERILQADSEQQIDELMQEGASYQFAHAATRRRWARAAINKRRQLKG